MFVEIILAFLVGVLAYRTYLARCNRIPTGTSWDRSNNQLYKFLHRINCELCPRRWYCKKYDEVKR